MCLHAFRCRGAHSFSHTLIIPFIFVDTLTQFCDLLITCLWGLATVRPCCHYDFQHQTARIKTSNFPTPCGFPPKNYISVCLLVSVWLISGSMDAGEVLSAVYQSRLASEVPVYDIRFTVVILPVNWCYVATWLALIDLLQLAHGSCLSVSEEL